MRKIEFRGKVIEFRGFIETGEWFYGSLVSDRKGCYIVSGAADVTDEYFQPEKWYTVDPETVGQFTGLEDKNGKKIFEGDILKIYDERIFQVVDSILVHEGAKPFYHILLKNSNYRKPLLYYETVNGFLFEVIGNVFDSADRGETTDQLKYELEQNGTEHNESEAAK